MKIYRLTQTIHEFTGGNPPEEYGTEAVRLTDGRIFYCKGMNHYPIIQYLRGRGINYTQFDAIGHLDPDGTWTSTRKGRNDIQHYMTNPGW